MLRRYSSRIALKTDEGGYPFGPSLLFLSVRVDYCIYVQKVVVLEEQTGGERFFPNRFTFLVLLVFDPITEKLI